MTIDRKRLGVFTLSALLTAGGWALWWPQRGTAESGQAATANLAGDAQAHAHERRPEFDLTGALSALAAAQTAEEKVAAMTKFAEMPQEQVPAALEGVRLYQDLELTQEATALLIRWASADGEAALRWSWLKLRQEGPWDDAVRQILSTWAYSDPRGLGRWLAQVTVSELTVSEAAASKLPLIDSSQRNRALDWLTPHDPETAFRLGGISPERIARLQTADQFRAALAGLAERKERSPEVYQPSFGLSTEKRLLERWRELDPVSFAAYPYPSRLAPESGPEAAENPDPNAAALAKWQEATPGTRAESAAVVLQPLDAFARGAMVVRLAGEWAEQDPQAAAGWLERQPPGERDTGAWAAVAGAAARQWDPAQTLQWLEELPAGRQAAAVLGVYDVWQAQPPESRPDLSAAPEAIRRTWQDLERLGREPAATAP